MSTTMRTTTRTDDHRLAAEVARLAGERLTEVRARGAGLSAEELGELGDQVAHELIVDELATHRPADSVLSEHGTVAGDRPGSRRWIVDPLDGTKEYAEPGRVDWAVHVALVEEGRLTAGAVALPAQGRLLGTEAPPDLPAPSARPRLVVSRRRPPAFIVTLAAELDAEMVPMGSAGAKVAAVLSGQADAYVHAGGQYMWDSAAPVAVAAAAGLHASRLDGSPLDYTAEDPWLPDLVVCVPRIADRLLAAITKHYSAAD